MKFTIGYIILHSYYHHKCIIYSYTLHHAQPGPCNLSHYAQLLAPSEGLATVSSTVATIAKFMITERLDTSIY